jgi:Holliday junction resolvase
MLDPKAKGRRGEYAALKKLKELGYDGYRVPLSGSHSALKGDIHLDNGLKVEVKVRREGFKQLYHWLTNVNFLMIRSTPGEWLAVIPFKLLKELLSGEKD